MATPQRNEEIARIVKENHPCPGARRGVVGEHTQRQREQIVRALTDSKGRVAGEDGAAARLGLNRTTLLSRMKKFSISAKQFC
jgi:formate hydrogenlyase transcriptional activator